MVALQHLFPDSSPITPAAPEPLCADFPHIPAKPAVYLLTTDLDPQNSSLITHHSSLITPNHPLLLATVGDLRAALKRRLADTPPDAKSKRVPYGTLCTRVHYRIVYSALAANFYYAQAARALFPQTAPALIPWQTSWWIAVERPGPAASPHPRFRKTNNLSDPALAYAGPIRDKHSAQRLVESLEDLFDLCRYHPILVQAPHGKPCAYKEMGKCPAPCDGSISLATYRQQIDAALAFATDTQPIPAQGSPSPGHTAPSPRAAWREHLAQQMKSAAASLHFESAAKIKQRLTRADFLNTDPYAALGSLEDFSFLSLQPGKGKPWIEPWLIHFDEDTTHAEQLEIENRKSKIENPIRCLPQFHIKHLPAAAENLARLCQTLPPSPSSLTPDQSQDAALIAHHLYRGNADHGLWLRTRNILAQGPALIIAAAQSLRARKAPKPLAEQATDALPQDTSSKDNPDAESLNVQP